MNKVGAGKRIDKVGKMLVSSNQNEKNAKEMNASDFNFEKQLSLILKPEEVEKMLHTQGVQHACADKKDESEASSKRSWEQKDGAAEEDIEPLTENEQAKALDKMLSTGNEQSSTSPLKDPQLQITTNMAEASGNQAPMGMSFMEQPPPKPDYGSTSPVAAGTFNNLIHVQNS